MFSIYCAKFSRLAICAVNGGGADGVGAGSANVVVDDPAGVETVAAAVRLDVCTGSAGEEALGNVVVSAPASAALAVAIFSISARILNFPEDLELF